MNWRLLLLVTLVVLIASIPFIGNTLAQQIIKEHLNVVQSNGIALETAEITSHYLTTQHHYLLTVKDTDQLLDYISRHHQQQIPTYVKGILDGTKMGVDISYSNIPWFKTITIGIYPTSLSPQMKGLITAEDPVLYSSIEKLLLNKTLYYEIDYDLGVDTFSGSIRDIIKLPISFQDGTTATITLRESVFDGSGTLIAPNRVIGTIKELSATVDTSTEQVAMTFRGITMNNQFRSLFDQHTSMQVNRLDLNLTDAQERVNMSLKEMTVESVSLENGLKIESSSYGTVEQFDFTTAMASFRLDNLKADLSINDLDKSAFEAVQIAINRANNNTTAQAQLDVINTVSDLLAKGLFFNLKELSVDGITINSDPAMGGFNHRVAITVRPDSAFRQKSRQHPMALMQNIDLNATLSFSKSFYNYVANALPQAAFVVGFAKDDGKTLRFDILLKNNQLTINGTPL